MAQQLAHRDGVGVDSGAVDAAGEIGLDGGVEGDPAFGDELQHCRRDECLGDAGGADMGVRDEAGAGVDVGVSRGVPGDVRAIADDGDATGEAVARDDVGQGFVDGGGVGVGGYGGQTQQQNDRCNDRFAH